ncbi:MAG TPA: GNAT family N-acetyltransferase [Candidatus Cloacimonadota bacterium]|nr:GNAT family N-acetyltransferase [Candidatus Cloacimonadota bacterium]HPT71173.1 GNAT family N-acetyltransferase [Candidatus Cloacimonadota bacterium]
MDEMSLNQRNWESLIALYEYVAASDVKFTKITEPFTAYLSDYYDWPNFIIIDSIGNDFSERVEELSDLIPRYKKQPYVLCHPLLARNTGLSEIFENHNIRQFDQWVNTFYDLKWGLPKDVPIQEYRTEIVTTDEQRKVWAEIGSNVFHHGRPIPVNSFTGNKFMLLIGYADEVPVATTMIFFDQEITSTYYVAVLKDYRGKGYGYQITRAAFTEIKKLGYDINMLQATQAGIKSWLRYGYKATGSIDIFMRLSAR